MTQVQITDSELNRKLAELMGYSVRKSASCYQIIKGPSYGHWQAEESHAWADAPDYCSDPAASLEAGKAAIAKSQIDYLHNLSKVTNPNADDFAPWTPDEIIKLLSATPRERAEAAYITLSQKE
ncbi:hypothetical protein [Paenibacillus donghaensis]|uniref:Phage ABA sandwich domain-containing protein n=1 Tax=Paenibacillus donghaensis TaxID=414771 RepID=A0A2Z2KD26_9BACL|nr:hypothetical protein [Paenibacillus donghaensis]ASA20920.1 hypothetical protein B9T62_09060 [Paenibacillus donghaensis]